MRRISIVVMFLSALGGCSSPRASSALADDVERRKVERVVERASLVVDGRPLSLHLLRGITAPVPSVLVFHSAMGRTESVLEWCDRLAERGFAAVALDFYDGKVATSAAERKSLRDAANARAAQLEILVQHVYDKLQQDPRLRSNQRFLLGWSFGGAWATYASGFLGSGSHVVHRGSGGFRSGTRSTSSHCDGTYRSK